jgi:hypothetical protein
MVECVIQRVTLLLLLMFRVLLMLQAVLMLLKL